MANDLPKTIGDTSSVPPDGQNIEVAIPSATDPKLTGSEPGFVKVHHEEPSQTPGKNNYVVADHDHDGINSPRIREQHIYRRRQRINITLPGSSAATSANWGAVFMATDPCRVRAVYEFHSALGTDGGAVTMQVEKLTGTTAPGSGTVILATAFNLKAAINTMQKAAFVGARSTRTLDYGDRLGIKPTGTLTSLAGVLIIIEVEFI